MREALIYAGVRVHSKDLQNHLDFLKLSDFPENHQITTLNYVISLSLGIVFTSGFFFPEKGGLCK